MGQSSAFLCTKALLYLDTKSVQEEKENERTDH